MNEPIVNLYKAMHEPERMNQGEIPFDLDFLKEQIKCAGDFDLTLNLEIQPAPGHLSFNRFRFKWLVVDTIAGPWFSLGFHIDFQRPYLDIHFVWWIITIGNSYESRSNNNEKQS